MRQLSSRRSRPLCAQFWVQQLARSVQHQLVPHAQPVVRLSRHQRLLRRCPRTLRRYVVADALTRASTAHMEPFPSPSDRGEEPGGTGEVTGEASLADYATGKTGGNVYNKKCSRAAVIFLRRKGDAFQVFLERHEDARALPSTMVDSSRATYREQLVDYLSTQYGQGNFLAQQLAASGERLRSSSQGTKTRSAVFVVPLFDEDFDLSPRAVDAADSLSVCG